MAKRRSPINELTDTQAAYIAGIIDGEGCIGLYAVNSHKDARNLPCPNLALTIANTSEELVRWLKDTVGAGNVKSKNIGNHPNWKQQYAWSIYSSKAEKLLRRVLPFMIVKKEQAEVGLAYRDIIPANSLNGCVPISQSVLDTRMTYVRRMKVLNRKGISPDTFTGAAQ